MLSKQQVGVVWLVGCVIAATTQLLAVEPNQRKEHFDGAITEFTREKGEGVFCRMHLQNAKDGFIFLVNTKTKIVFLKDDKHVPAQFTDLTPDSTVKATYDGVVGKTDPPLAVASEIVIVKQAPLRPGHEFEGTTDNSPFQQKDA